MCFYVFQVCFFLSRFVLGSFFFLLKCVFLFRLAIFLDCFLLFRFSGLTVFDVQICVFVGHVCCYFVQILSCSDLCFCSGCFFVVRCVGLFRSAFVQNVCCSDVCCCSNGCLLVQIVFLCSSVCVVQLVFVRSDLCLLFRFVFCSFFLSVQT